MGTTPLATELIKRIEADGPMPLDRFMALCLLHPKYGYYKRGDVFGAGGDFTTAPEISQMFGEIIGAWVVHVWQKMGEPKSLNLIELGPGRGTMMADILRTARIVKSFTSAVNLHFVETSQALSAIQARTLGCSEEDDGSVQTAEGIKVTWHSIIETVPEGPSIFLANEFFDALPIRQIIRKSDGWYERCVAVDNNNLTFGLANRPWPEKSLPKDVKTLMPGSIVEICDPACGIIDVLTRRLLKDDGALLVIDYGYGENAYGDTFQALRKHAHVNPLAYPGESDLTAHVNFPELKRVAKDIGGQVHGPVKQGNFLQELGIYSRCEALQTANPDHADRFKSAIKRLVGGGQNEMGHLFKVMAVTSPDLTDIPGFSISI